LKTLRSIAIPIEDIFFECKFKDQIINCTDSFKQVALKNSLCYTFNGVDVDGSTNEVVKEWTIDDGYAPTASMDTYPNRAMGAGSRFGFSILLGYKNVSSRNLCDSEPGFFVCMKFVMIRTSNLETQFSDQKPDAI
jgi:Amiloride-sensitive sodium channel